MLQPTHLCEAYGELWRQKDHSHSMVWVAPFSCPCGDTFVYYYFCPQTDFNWTWSMMGIKIASLELSSSAQFETEIAKPWEWHIFSAMDLGKNTRNWVMESSSTESDWSKQRNCILWRSLSAMKREKVHYIGYDSSYDKWKESGELEVYGGGFQLESYIPFSLYSELRYQIKRALNSGSSCQNWTGLWSCALWW